MPIEDNISDNPSPSESGPASAEPRPHIQGHPNTTPTDTTPGNIRLERARRVAEKKRKSDDKMPSAPTKKQKASATLAIPSDGNSIK